jgi:hypothetical protein
MEKISKMPKVTIVVTGDVRRAAAAVEGIAIQLQRNANGDLEGSESVTVQGADLNVAMTIAGQAGTTFEVGIEMKGKTVTRKGRMKTDVALRGYTIPLSDF